MSTHLWGKQQQSQAVCYCQRCYPLLRAVPPVHPGLLLLFPLSHHPAQAPSLTQSRGGQQGGAEVLLFLPIKRQKFKQLASFQGKKPERHQQEVQMLTGTALSLHNLY